MGYRVDSGEIRGRGEHGERTNHGCCHATHSGNVIKID